MATTELQRPQLVADLLSFPYEEKNPVTLALRRKIEGARWNGPGENPFDVLCRNLGRFVQSAAAQKYGARLLLPESGIRYANHAEVKLLSKWYQEDGIDEEEIPGLPDYSEPKTVQLGKFDIFQFGHINRKTGKFIGRSSLLGFYVDGDWDISDIENEYSSLFRLTGREPHEVNPVDRILPAVYFSQAIPDNIFNVIQNGVTNLRGLSDVELVLGPALIQPDAV